MRIGQSLFIYFSLLASICSLADGFDPFVTPIVGLSMATIAGFAVLSRPIYCVMKECCHDRWIKTDLPNLKSDLEANVYGQHLAINSVVSALRAHLRGPRQTALVLSFHGWTGTGKNLVAQLVAENMYEEGMKSQYVHVLSATKHFARHELAADYKDQIRNWVVGNVTACGRQLFIFDEVEKMPDGVLDVLKPFLDHYAAVQGVDYRDSVFIFLGNAGGEALFSKTYDHFLSGRNRDDLEIHDTESILWKEAYNTKGGFKASSLITSNLVSHYIPFLPLEKSHVRQCIEKEIEGLNITELTTNPTLRRNKVTEILKHLSFTPPNIELYSTSGCKRVFAKTRLVLDEYYID